MAPSNFDARRFSELQPSRNSEFRERGSDKMGIISYLGIGALVAAATGIAAFCGDVGGIRTETGKALRPYTEAADKRKYDPVNVNGIDYILIGKDAYTLGTVTPLKEDGRITLRQRVMGSVQNWSDFDTAVKTLNGGGEPIAGVPYKFPSSTVSPNTTLYDRVVRAHRARQ